MSSSDVDPGIPVVLDRPRRVRLTPWSLKHAKGELGAEFFDVLSAMRIRGSSSREFACRVLLALLLDDDPCLSLERGMEIGSAFFGGGLLHRIRAEFRLGEWPNRAVWGLAAEVSRGED